MNQKRNSRTEKRTFSKFITAMYFRLSELIWYCFEQLGVKVDKDLEKLEEGTKDK